MRDRRLLLLPLLAFLLGTAAAPRAGALERDGWRVGIQVGGTGLVSLLAEYHADDNAISLNAGIFDSLGTPAVSLWYRRYVRLAPLDDAGLVPYVGAGAVVFTGIHALYDPIVFLAAATGLDWNFLSAVSLCVEGDALLNVRPWPLKAAFLPALSLRAGF